MNLLTKIGLVIFLILSCIFFNIYSYSFKANKPIKIDLLEKKEKNKTILLPEYSAFRKKNKLFTRNKINSKKDKLAIVERDDFNKNYTKKKAKRILLKKQRKKKINQTVKKIITQKNESKQNLDNKKFNVLYSQMGFSTFGISYASLVAIFLTFLMLGSIIILKMKKDLLKRLGIFSAAITIIFTALLTYNEFKKVGNNQGYGPEQPIYFSHELHAGKLNINCLYCHSGAEKSKHAGIPSANVCMNCHSQVKSRKGADPNYLVDYNGEKVSRELKELYEAVENKKPIEWIKIHNLADFVYFSHQQHVAVGGKAILGRDLKTPEDVKQTCYACHGKVGEMDLVYQSAPLTMGWCLDCHRKTPSPSRKGMSVFEAGGGECARCHY